MSSSGEGLPQFSRREFGLGMTALFASSHGPLFAAARQFRFGVFSLFDSRELTLQADEPLLLTLKGGAEARYLLAANSPPAVLRWVDGTLLALTLGRESFSVSQVSAASPLGLASFTLAIPTSEQHGSIRRGFRGALTVISAGHHLQPVISMERESAVGSIVGAESPPDAPLQFLLAQAVASRSFLLAGRPGHPGFDFCDTTHCQYLRSPPAPGSPAQLAAARTSGLSLRYGGRTLAAMYSRSCSGKTRSLAELGLPAGDYPYYAVRCDFCVGNPELWNRSLDDEKPPHGERQRIAFDRVHGWSAIPSDNFTETCHRLNGRGIGHGIGLCQSGAAAMARAGAAFDEILAHYYPNTSLATV
jgi:stage II sporulation protein D